MKIQFKLPAVAIDDEGAEQEIELTLEVIPVSFITSDGDVKGNFTLFGGGMMGGLEVSFKFHEEHPFNVRSKWRLPIRKPQPQQPNEDNIMDEEDQDFEDDEDYEFDHEDEYCDYDNEDDFLIDGVGFADPGGNSALRAATKNNPRNLPCPECERENQLTPLDVAAGYRCDRCADRAEHGGY